MFFHCFCTHFLSNFEDPKWVVFNRPLLTPPVSSIATIRLLVLGQRFLLRSLGVVQ